VLALRLPDGDSEPLIDMLRTHGIPIVLQTGLATPAEIEARFPGLPVVTKPFAAEDLVDQLRSLIDEVAAPPSRAEEVAGRPSP